MTVYRWHRVHMRCTEDSAGRSSPVYARRLDDRHTIIVGDLHAGWIARIPRALFLQMIVASSVEECTAEEIARLDEHVRTNVSASGEHKIKHQQVGQRNSDRP